MIIYNKASTAKKYVSGVLMGVFVLPAIYLFTLGFIFYGIGLIIIYLASETLRSGVDFNFNESKLTAFREVLFIKVRKGERRNLDSFSHYRVKLKNETATMSANWVQTSTVSQERHTLELFNQHNGEFLEIVKSDVSEIQPLLIKLEEQNITSKD